MAGLLVLAAACEQKPIEPDDPGQEPAKDEIAVTPESAEVENSGDKVEVLVTSSGEWTLSSSEKYDWVTPSAVEGKDGDKVLFEVKPNETLEDRNATFTFSCGEADGVFTLLQKKADPVVRVIELSPAELSFEADGGNADVMVTSLVNDESAAWTLTPSEEYEWVTPSATEGSDGDVVTFSVQKNNGKDPLTAKFVFANGDETAELTVTSNIKVWTLALTTEAELEFDNEGTDFTVSVESNIPAENLFVSVPEEASWITSKASNPGDNSVDFFFNAAANATFENRSAVITISNGEDLSVTVTVNQKQTDRLEVSAKEIILGLEGGDFEIPVITNVEYRVDLSDASGITHVATAADNVEKFKAEAVSDRTTYNIVFKPVASSVPEVKVPVTLKKSALINYVANMKGNYAYPAWDTPSVVNNLNALTFEMLVYIPEFKSGKEISTLMGIEDYFLLRMGDGASVFANTMQLAYKGGALKLADFNVVMHKNQWIHIAVTFNNGAVTYYYNGMQVTTGTIPLKSVSLGIPHNGEEGKYPNLNTRFFWIGYSCSADRDFPGYMSEVRIWNRALTPAELKADSNTHKYKVDPASEGLVAYWRFNEDDMGQEKVKDWTTNGNDLTVKKAIDWVSVSLP